ncbi:hypothetical protein HerbRD11066_29730 [Herbidospora sp. RD11066]
MPVTGAPKYLLLLAALLSRAGQPVTTEWLIAVVWGDGPPASARRNVQLYVHQLRRAFGADLVAGRPGGYAIIPEGLDAVGFRGLAHQGVEALESGDPERARELLKAALDLWRGPAFAEFLDAPAIAEEARRLEETRLVVAERLAEAELGLGRHVEVAAELAVLTREHPFRESLRGHLMLALYRSGRQAEALEVFRQTREELDDQLGIEPGPALQRLHEAMLRGDDDLLPAAAIHRAVSDVCPYRGLMAFQPDDHEWFFGRSELVGRLRELVGARPVVGVFGASGSGKSSLLRAGLLGGWPGEALIITPGAFPMESLDKIDGEPLVVVDQFEEIFTLCADDDERHRFVAALLDLDAHVVLGVRADFLAHLTRFPGLADAIGTAQLLVGPLSATGLREIVTGPAELAGLAVDPDLPAMLVADAAGEPGSLPLVSHALMETWRNREGARLTLAGYQAAGGVRGAIAQSAERVHGELSPAERQAARRIFLRLTALGDGTEDTRRPISQTELTGVADPGTIARVLDRLAAARLIVLTEDGVDVAHEALIRAWPRLHGWLTDDREHLVVHRRLTDAAQTWEDLGRDPGALYRGVRLLAAQTWANDHPQELNDVETAFLTASSGQERAERDTVKRRARTLQRLLAGMAALFLLAVTGGAVALEEAGEAGYQQMAATARQVSLLARSLLATDPDLAGLLAVAAYKLNPEAETRGGLESVSAAARRSIELNAEGPAIFAVAFSPDGSRLAAAGEDGSVTVWNPRTKALISRFTEPGGGHGRGVAFSRDGRSLAYVVRSPALGSSAGAVVVRDLATGAEILRERRDHLTDALAFDGDRLAFADGNVVEMVAGGSARLLKGNRADIAALAFSPDGKVLVSSGGLGEHPAVWAVSTGEKVGTLDTENVHRLGFDASDGTLATGSSHLGVRLWRVTPTEITDLGGLPHRSPYTWDMSAPAHGRIAVADEDGLITVWDLTRHEAVATYQDRSRTEALSLALSTDATLMASAGLGRTIVVRQDPVPPFTGHSGAVNDIEASPDGTVIASVSSDETVRLWDASGTPIATLADHPDHVRAVAFSPDGRSLASVTRSHTLTLWDLATFKKTATTTYPGLGASTDVAFQPGGRFVAATALGRFRWSLPSLSEAPLPGQLPSALAFSPTAPLLVSTGPAGDLLLWDLAADKEVRSLRTHQGSILDVAFSPDGKTIATAGADHTVKMWDTGSGQEKRTLTGHTAPVQTLVFSRDGRTLASAGDDHTVVVWDLPSAQMTARLTGHTAPIRGLAFTATGELVSGGEDGRIIRWSLHPDALAAKMCAQVGRDLTREEWNRYIPALDYRPTCR